MATILVTGGAGFIGSHVADALLARGDTVRIIDDLSTGQRNNIPEAAHFIHADIADTEAVANAAQPCDGIVHLAAVASVQRCRNEWALSHRTNMLGTINVLDAAAKLVPSAPVVYASSAAVYGDNPTIPLSETMPPAPLTSYGMDKWANERYAQLAHSHYGLSSVGLRFFNVYGPRQSPDSPYSGVISLFANAAKTNSGITLFGDGSQTRDFIHVSDIVRLVLLALDYASANQAAEVVNGCRGEQTSLLALIRGLEAIHATELAIRHANRREGDIRFSQGNPAHARALLGFEATTSLDEGLRTLR